MTDLTLDDIVEHLRDRAVPFTVLAHGPSATSQESFDARSSVAGRPITGAKALVVRASHGGATDLVLVVLRGQDRLSSSSLRKTLRTHHGSRVSISFATPQELGNELRGLEPGRVPPFGQPLLPRVDLVLVDTAILAEEEIGFNAADFRRSIAMSSSDLQKVLPASTIIAELAEASGDPT